MARILLWNVNFSAPLHASRVTVGHNMCQWCVSNLSCIWSYLEINFFHVVVIVYVYITPKLPFCFLKKSTVIQGWVKTHVIAVSPPPASEKYGVFIAQSTDVIHLVSSQDFWVMKPWYESACARTRDEDAEMLIVCPVSYISPVVDASLWTQAVWSKSLKFKTLP